jgi:hypothetical protein
MTTGKAISHLLILALVLTPIFGLQEWLEIVPAFNHVVDNELQMAVKATKDILLAMILLLFALDVLRGRPILAKPLIWVMFSLALIASLITSARGKPLLALIGLRSLSPLLLVFVAHSYLDMAFMKRMLRVLLFIFILECCAATIQVLIGSPISGHTFFKLAGRPFGTFAKPWSLAVFICFIVCFTIGWDVHCYGRPRRMALGLALVSAFFVYLTASGAGVLTLATMLTVYILVLKRNHPYAKAAIVPAILLAPAVAFYNLTWLTGRTGVFRSVHSRLGILHAFADSSGIKEMLIGRDMGLGSNAAMTFSRLGAAEFGGANSLFISDSLYVSLLSQAGFIFLLCFLAFNALLFERARRSRCQGMNPVAIMMIPAALAASLGGNVLELYPVNWLLCIVYGAVLREARGRAGREAGTVSETYQHDLHRYEVLA